MSPIELMERANLLVNAILGHQGPDAQHNAALVLVGATSPDAADNRLAIAIKAALLSLKAE